MNLYLLVEGKVTEMVVYARWLPYLLPGMTEVKRISEVRHNHFFLFSGYGYPNIMRRMAGSVMDINRHGNIDYLVICLDSEESSVDQRYRTVMKRLSSLNTKLTGRTKVKVIVHNRCIETWFLGNRKLELYPSRIQNHKLRLMVSDYSVFEDDPERLPANRRIEDCSTTAQYHYSYLKNLFNEHRMHYTKKNPGRTVTRGYLRELTERYRDTGHIPSFGFFLHFIEELRGEMERERRAERRRTAEQRREEELAGLRRERAER